MKQDYNTFIESKIILAHETGMMVTDADINPMLYPHQCDITRWAILGGRRAIFASFGLGKTFIQLETCRIIQGRKGGKTLTICPLGVKQEFTEDGKMTRKVFVMLTHVFPLKNVEPETRKEIQNMSNMNLTKTTDSP